LDIQAQIRIYFNDHLALKARAKNALLAWPDRPILFWIINGSRSALKRPAVSGKMNSSFPGPDTLKNREFLPAKEE